MKFSTEAVEQGLDMVAKGIFRPSDELAPMVLGLLPEDFDHVEFRAVRREITQEGVVVGHPAQRRVVVQAMMDPGIIQDDECRCWLGHLGKQAINERDEGVPVDRTHDLLVVKALVGEVKGPHDGNALVVRRHNGMRDTHRRPGALYGRRGREAGFIKIDQLTSALTRPVFEAGKFRLAGGKSYGIAVFFRLNRVRLKLKPRAFRASPKVSSEHGSAH